MDAMLSSISARLNTTREKGRVSIDEETVDAAKALGFFVSRKPRRVQINLTLLSDLRVSPRSIAVVTTASLPWMTGTAVNPILRAVHLARDGHNVTLVIPWVPSRDSQLKIFGGKYFASQKQQAGHVRNWLNRQGYSDVNIRLIFYLGVYSERYGSVFPVKAVTDVFRNAENFEKDVCILEEPEHLTWHHPGSPWPEIFQVVIGIIHTNYVEYARHDGPLGKQRAFLLMLLNIWVARSYCHRIIKLSDAVQFFPYSITCNVHGVNERFLDIGRKSSSKFDHDVYFMAKTLWTKGYSNLLALLRSHYKRTGKSLKIRFFGNGPDAPAVLQEIRNDPALSEVDFQPKVVDHAGSEIQRYKVYVNASVSEVVCTATAEALAMGKTVVIIKHDSNKFFESFRNCHVFQTAEQFSSIIDQVSKKNPLPLSRQELFRLSWKAATNRFYDSCLVPNGNKHPYHVDQALANCHSTLSRIYPNPGQSMLKEQEGEDSDDTLAGELT